ncbi:Oidioi.mRNA.OKI2018_I69.chr2.g8353.t1.cds [Oikopleura dioica]|uniref:Oidioi.mRNA.OKI2018_I69.chr2.g8353.t1.cds n=1 Tax=Oikopleura dioica TaxID=34765 RepID=A0ABN7T8Z8_OIKDI|nr:Oidioi.mRNA.OKI2018_I69.chr2.g8353.t1.cds [Oikopleura dioica]
MVITMFIPAVLFKFIENRTFLDAFYFVVISLTTVGFGDITPSFKDSLIFVIYRFMVLMWIFFGLAYIGGLAPLINEIFNNYIYAELYMKIKRRFSEKWMQQSHEAAKISELVQKVHVQEILTEFEDELNAYSVNRQKRRVGEGSVNPLGGSQVTLISDDDNLDVGVFTIFKVWALGAAVITVIKLVLWTPNSMPLKIATNTEYSLFENSFIIRKIRGQEIYSEYSIETKEDDKAGNISEETYTIKDVLKNLNFYILFLGHAGLTMRRGSYLGWLGSGWPEWVAGDDDPAGFNAAINKRQSQLAFIFLFCGLLPGMYCDLCRKFMNKNGSQKGDAFGLGTSFITSAIMLSASSFLQAQRDKDLAMASCILHNIGRAFGVMWNPAYFYLFPQNVYGFVFGSISVLIQPFTLLLIPILDFNQSSKKFKKAK